MADHHKTKEMIMINNDSELPVSLSGTKAETLMWAHEHEVDHAALNQLRNIAAMPWVAGVRVMPDVHLDVIWTRCKQVADSVRGPEATRLRH